MKKILAAAAAVVLVCVTVCPFLFSDREYSAVYTGLGTVISVKIKSQKGKEVNKELSELFTLLEDTLDANDSSSVLSAFNETNETDNEIIADLTNRCIPLTADTNGAFDFSLGALTRLWHIGFSDEKVPDENEIADALKNRGTEKIICENGTVKKPESVKLDFGGAAKGYACDRAAEILKKENAKSAVISVGGSLLFWGKNGLKECWTAAVRDPFDSNKYAGTFNIKGGFVSTSGSYERYFDFENERYHHILDPETGFPAKSDLVSVTVIAPNGTVSDALSTACFILGEEKSKAVLEKYSAKAIFIYGDKSVSADIDFVCDGEYFLR